MRVELLGSIDKEERAKIISSAGTLSRTPGTVFEVYDSRNDYESNIKMIKRIISMGHKSIIEHDYYVFALQDVTPIIEQTIIGYRLTSFTIKSRREVDFSKVGFYVPTFHDEAGNIHEENAELTKIYKEYMQSLFQKYETYIARNISKEDSRFILPYSYHSNIIMGMDARELERMVTDLLYGNVSHIDEAKELGTILEQIINENIPYMAGNLKKGIDNEDKILQDLYKKFGASDIVTLEKPTLLSYTENVDERILASMIMSRYQCTNEKANKMVAELTEEEKRAYMQYLIQNRCEREFEQVNFNYQIPISLAVLTHLTRHRMHALMVPNFVPLWNLENYDIPDSIKALDEEEYREIYRKNREMKDYFKSKHVRDEDLIYFYLSGNMCNVLTTINGSSLKWISSMRCCNKAQKQIRDIAKELVREAKEVAPLFGEGLGASCEVFDFCPEGKECCGKILELRKKK